MAKEKVEEIEVMNVPDKEFLSTYKKDVKLIEREFGKVESSFLNIGFSLHRIYKSEGFKIDGYKTIYEFAKDKFNLARGTTNNFINVVETFGKQVDGKFMDELEDKYKGFKPSQLIALLGYINRGGSELDCFTSDMSVRDVKSKIKELECSSCEDDSEVVEDDGSEVVVPAKECKNTLISCMGLDDYNCKVDEIDALILNMFNKSKKRVRIEIVAIEY